MFNPYIVVPLSVWAIAQFIKFILAASKGKLDFKYLYASGGMPSVHAAVVTSLATTAFLLEGINSPIFGITVILAGIVMYDSFGVRRSSGEQAVAINAILEGMSKEKIHLTLPQRHLRELLGHKPLEVAVGATLGIFLAGLFNIDRLDALFSLLSTPSPKLVTYTIAATSIIMIAGGFIARYIFIRKYGKVATVSNAIKQSYWFVLSIGLIGLILAFLQNEKIRESLWIIWPILLAIILLGSGLWLIARYQNSVPTALNQYNAYQEKQKWLEGPNKKKRKEKAKKRAR